MALRNLQKQDTVPILGLEIPKLGFLVMGYHNRLLRSVCTI